MYVPERGDAIWLNFTPQAGHEQAGRRPALVLSPRDYNRKTGLVVCCPITNRIKNYPFEVRLPKNTTVTGVVLADQLKNLDWQKRDAAFISHIDKATTQQVVEKIYTLLS